MSVPDASGALRQHLLPGVGVLSVSGSIDQSPRGVLAPIVLWHIRIGPVVEFAGGRQQRSYGLEPGLFADHYRSVKRTTGASISVDGPVKHGCVTAVGG